MENQDIYKVVKEKWKYANNMHCWQMTNVSKLRVNIDDYSMINWFDEDVNGTM